MQPCASSHGRCTGADQQLDVHHRWYTVVQLSPAYRFSSARDVHTCPPAQGALVPLDVQVLAGAPSASPNADRAEMSVHGDRSNISRYAHARISFLCVHVMH
jgi:hypothetical protein